MTRPLGKDEKIPYELLLLADETTNAIDRYIHSSETYVLEKGSAIVAVYVLQSHNKDTVEIKNIAVGRKHQGQGIGRRLLREAVDRAAEKGFSEIIIGTADAATRQLSLYKSEGFVAFDVRKNFFVDNYPHPLYEGGVPLKDMILLKKIVASDRKFVDEKITPGKQ